MTRARRYDRAIALLVIDLDHFMVVNDTFGHLAGDAVLRQIAAVLFEGLREVDKLARWGGEEFVAVLPETGRTGASLVAERLCSSIEQTTIEYDDKSISCTVSIGVAAMEPPLGTLDETIDLADEAVYRAKAAGRNQVAFSRARQAPIRIHALTPPCP